MKKLLSNSYQRNADVRINKIVYLHKTLPNSKASTALNSRCPSAIGYRKLNRSINEQDAAYIFKEKLEDLEMPPSASAESRFIEQFSQAIQTKTLKLGSFGLGPKGFRALLNVICLETKFAVFDLSSNKIGDEGAIYLAQYLYSNPPIISIDLRSNGITGTGFSALFQALVKNTHLTSLDISAMSGIERNKIGLNGCMRLAQMLSTNEIVSYLNVSLCGFPGEGCSAISQALSKNKGLLYLDISSNRFASVGANNLFSAENCLGQLEYLNLSKNGITDSVTNSLCRQLSSPNHLITLDLSHNKLSKKFIKAFSSCIQNCPLQNLNLSYNSLNPECGEYISFIIMQSPSLISLNLSSNKLGDDGIQHIAKSIRKSKFGTLKSLDLSDTFLGNKGAEYLAESISKQNRLEKLNVSNNTIGDQGGVALVNALIKDTVMHTFNIQNNELGGNSAIELIEMLHNNHTLLEVSFGYNDFPYQVEADLKQALIDHKKFLNTNISEYANRHIEVLKEDERHLFEVRDELAVQSQEVRKFQEEQETKNKYFEELKKERETESISKEQILDKIKQEYEEVRDHRIEVFAQYTEMVRLFDREKDKAKAELQNLNARKTTVENRLIRAQSNKNNVEEKITHQLDDLKIHCFTLKQDLMKLMIKAQKEKDEIIRKQEEEDLLQEEAERAAREKLEAEMRAASEVDEQRSVMTLEEKRKKIKKAKSSPIKKSPKKSTQNSPKIVKPTDNSDVL